jgi:hypothetical protein
MSNRTQTPPIKTENMHKSPDTKRIPYTKPNIALLLFDILLIPIQIIRLILIYIWGSKYNIPGFQFLDVIMHADSPYFNKEDCSAIDTLKGDYRVVIREDSRLFATDINNILSIKNIETEKNTNTQTHQTINIKNPDHINKINNDTADNINVVVGYTRGLAKTEWNIDSECVDDYTCDDAEQTTHTDISDNSDDTDDGQLDDNNQFKNKLKRKTNHKTKHKFSLSDTPNTERQSSSNMKIKDRIKGVDYFESNDDEKDKKKKTSVASSVLDSIKQELNSAFEV